MKIRTSSLCALLLASTLGLAGCNGDSTTGNTGDPLTDEEVERIFEVLFFLGIAGPFEGIGEPEDGPFSGEVDTVIPCDDETGGASIEIAYEGTYDAEDDVGHLEGAGVLDFLGCLLIPGEVVTLTLDGDPGVDVEWEFDVDGDVINYTASFDGGIEFEASDERSGRCAVDFTIQAEGDGASDLQASGSLCGADASEFEGVFAP